MIFSTSFPCIARETHSLLGWRKCFTGEQAILTEAMIKCMKMEVLSWKFNKILTKNLNSLSHFWLKWLILQRTSLFIQPNISKGGFCSMLLRFELAMQLDIMSPAFSLISSFPCLLVLLLSVEEWWVLVSTCWKHLFSACPFPIYPYQKVFMWKGKAFQQTLIRNRETTSKDG